MNTFFIKIFFSFISFVIFEYVVSFAGFQIKESGNILGSIFLIIFCIGGVVFGNIVFWCN